MDVREMRNEALGKRVVKALESRNMEAYYVKTKEEAVKKALELIPKGSTINMGGSASVRECGLIDAVCSDDYVFYDRDKAATVEERHEIALKAFTSDWFLGSVNAMPLRHPARSPEGYQRTSAPYLILSAGSYLQSPHLRSQDLPAYC